MSIQRYCDYCGAKVNKSDPEMNNGSYSLRVSVRKRNDGNPIPVDCCYGCAVAVISRERDLNPNHSAEPCSVCGRTLFVGDARNARFTRDGKAICIACDEKYETDS